ncbi:MAG: DMT family transporter [Anaerolineae bacterium]|nr:DMT family transporter [Anaerolineae bacterium]
MTIQALPYILLLGFLFGSSLIASRFGVGQFHPITYLGLRTVLASLSYGAVYAISYRRRAWPTNLQLWRHAIVLGILGTAVPMVGVISSLQYLSSGVAAIMITAGPALTVLLAHFFLGDELLTLRKGVGVVLALGGALLIAGRGESGLADVGQTNPIGYALIFTAIVFGSSMTIYSRKYMRHYNSLDVASIRMVVATLVIMPVAILFIGIDLRQVDNQGYFSLFYAALAGNFVGMFLVFYNIKRFGATAAAMTDYVVPVVAGLGGVFLLGEQITMGMVVGMGFIMGGILLINRPRRRPYLRPF